MLQQSYQISNLKTTSLFKRDLLPEWQNWSVKRALGGTGTYPTVPQSQGDPKIVKRGPKGDPIFGKKGTQRGPNFWQKVDPKGTLFDVKVDLKFAFFRIVHKC